MSGICDWWGRMGEAWGRPVDPPPETIPPPGHIFHRNQKLFKPHMERGWSSQVQLDAMDEEGIDLAVLYPSRGLNVLSIPAMDPEFAAALARAYNNWLYEFCQIDTQQTDRRRYGFGVRHRERDLRG